MAISSSHERMLEEIILAFLDCMHIEVDRSLNNELQTKATNTDRYLLFDSHHSLEHKPGGIRTLHHETENMPTRAGGKKLKHKHISKPVKRGVIQTGPLSEPQKDPIGAKYKMHRRKTTNGTPVIPHIWRDFLWDFNEHCISVHQVCLPQVLSSS